MIRNFDKAKELFERTVADTDHRAVQDLERVVEKQVTDGDTEETTSQAARDQAQENLAAFELTFDQPQIGMAMVRKGTKFFIQQTAEGSPARSLGLQDGDVITHVASQSLPEDIDSLVSLIADSPRPLIIGFQRQQNISAAAPDDSASESDEDGPAFAAAVQGRGRPLHMTFEAPSLPQESSPSTKTKRGKNAYTIFLEQNRDSIRVELEESEQYMGQTVPVTAVTRAAGAKWKALSEEDRAHWNNLATEVKAAADAAAASHVSSLGTETPDEEEAVEHQSTDFGEITALGNNNSEPTDVATFFIPPGEARP